MRKRRKDPPAVVLGLTSTGLGVIRSLGREGTSLHGFDYQRERHHHGFHSRYAKTSLCPHPVTDPEELLEFLLNRFGDEPLPPILFPTADEFVSFMSDQRDRLSPAFRFNLPPREIVDSIVDKKIQVELIAQAGILIPDTICPETREELSAVAGDLMYPVIVRGRSSYGWREAYGGEFKGFKAMNEKELAAQCRAGFENDIPLIIQSVIPGPPKNHFKFCAYVRRDGRFASTFTLRKIRKHPPEFGIGSSVESIRHDELQELGQNLFAAIGYRGVGSAEFKLDPADDRLKFIELNPRYWMQNELAAFCGANMALVQYRDLSGREIPPQNKIVPGPVWVDAVLDFKSFIHEPENRRPRKILGWFRFLLGCDVYSVLCVSDMKPFLRAIRYGLKLFILPVKVLGRLVFGEKGKSGVKEESEQGTGRRKLTKEPLRAPEPVVTGTTSSSSRNFPGRTQ